MSISKKVLSVFLSLLIVATVTVIVNPINNGITANAADYSYITNGSFDTDLSGWTTGTQVSNVDAPESSGLSGKVAFLNTRSGSNNAQKWASNRIRQSITLNKGKYILRFKVYLPVDTSSNNSVLFGVFDSLDDDRCYNKCTDISTSMVATYNDTALTTTDVNGLKYAKNSSGFGYSIVGGKTTHTTAKLIEVTQEFTVKDDNKTVYFEVSSSSQDTNTCYLDDVSLDSVYVTAKFDDENEDADNTVLVGVAGETLTCPDVPKKNDYLGFWYCKDEKGEFTAIAPELFDIDNATYYARYRRLGDVDGDFDGVNAADLVAFRKHLLDIEDAKLEGIYLQCADSNGDGDVDIRDLVNMKKKSSEAPTT